MRRVILGDFEQDEVSCEVSTGPQFGVELWGNRAVAPHWQALVASASNLEGHERGIHIGLSTEMS